MSWILIIRLDISIIWRIISCNIVSYHKHLIEEGRDCMRKMAARLIAKSMIRRVNAAGSLEFGSTIQWKTVLFYLQRNISVIFGSLPNENSFGWLLAGCVGRTIYHVHMGWKAYVYLVVYSIWLSLIFNLNWSDIKGPMTLAYSGNHHAFIVLSLCSHQKKSH